jgi:predicted nucleic acid-binding protein
LTTYADSSFFVSLYLTDQHSLEARRRIAGSPPLWLTPLHRAEWMHAVMQHVFQRRITVSEARQFCRHFETDRSVGLWREVRIPDAAWETCIDLARRHVAGIGARTLDTLHVACALELGATEFWTFDQRQAELAAAAGLLC